MTAEQDGLNPAKVMAEHHDDGDGWCDSCQAATAWPCLPYRLAALALDLSKRADLMDGAYRAKWAAEDRAEKAEALTLDLQAKVEQLTRERDEALARIERIENGWCRTNRECIEQWNRADAEKARADAAEAKVRAALDKHEHAETCAFSLSLSSDAPCNCWQSEFFDHQHFSRPYRTLAGVVPTCSKCGEKWTALADPEARS